MNQEEYLKKLYSNRFDYRQRKVKYSLWKVLIENFLQEYISLDSVVLDIGGGYCEFINQVKAKEKYLIDLNPDSKLFAAHNVKIFNVDILNVKDREVMKTEYDIIFVSNFFEHLNSKEELVSLLLFCFNHLNPGGSLLVIQPNYKYSYKEYYDFIDHQLPVTHLSLKEVLEAIGFKINILIPKFLPFSTQGRPTSPKLLKLYLKLPLLWLFFGGQMFVKASKPF
ncbi:MAG TPA: methyltransferase domain-containing protein [Leptolyngbyaceae cyanobacterium]